MSSYYSRKKIFVKQNFLDISAPGMIYLLQLNKILQGVVQFHTGGEARNRQARQP